MLILDQARIHTKDFVATVNINLVFVPAGCTSIVQPVDVGWNKLFKGMDTVEAARPENTWQPAGSVQNCTAYCDKI